jgi:hypothetical protein
LRDAGSMAPLTAHDITIINPTCYHWDWLDVTISVCYKTSALQSFLEVH